MTAAAKLSATFARSRRPWIASCAIRFGSHSLSIATASIHRRSTVSSQIRRIFIRGMRLLLHLERWRIPLRVPFIASRGRQDGAHQRMRLHG